MSNITQPSDRFLLTSDFAGSVTGDSGTAVTAGAFSSAGRTGEFNMPTSFGALMNWETGDGSFSFWTTLSGPTDTYDYIGSDRNAAPYAEVGSLGFANNGGSDLTFYYHQPPAGHTNPSVSTVGWGIGTPIHVMLVKDSAAGNMKVYVNGVLENTAAWPSAAWGYADNRQWRFGGFNGNSTFDWPGSIADIAVWDGVALSASEALAIYNAGQGGEWVSGIAGLRKFKKRFWLSYDDGSYSIRAASSASDAPGLSLTLENGPRRGRETVEIVNNDKALVGIGKKIHVVTAPEGAGNSSLSASHDLSAILPEFGSECQLIRKKKNNPGTIFMLDETGKLFKAQSNDGWDTISSASMVRDLTLDGFPTNIVDLSSDNAGRVIAIGSTSVISGPVLPTVTFVDAEAGTIVVSTSIKPELAALDKVWDINYFPDTGKWYAADGAIPGPQTIISTDDITNWFDGTSMAAPSFAMPSTFASLVGDWDALNGATYNENDILLQIDDQSGNGYHIVGSELHASPQKVTLEVNDAPVTLPAALDWDWTMNPHVGTVGANMTDFTIAMIIPTYQFDDHTSAYTNFSWDPTYNTYLSMERLNGNNELRFVTQNSSGNEHNLWIRNYWNATQMTTDIGYHPDNGLGANAIVIFRRDVANNITKVDTWYNKDDGSATVKVPQVTAADFLPADFAGVGAIIMGGRRDTSQHAWVGGQHRAALFDAALSDADVISLAQAFANVVGMDGVE